MRIAVIGAGAIGGTIAVLASAAGHEVEITARGDHLTRIRRDGLHLDGAWGVRTAAPTAAETLTAPPDAVFLCTKAQDADAALRANAALADGALCVVVQNGIGGAARASAILPRSGCVGALAIFAAQFVSDGRISVTAAGPTYLGAEDGTSSSAVADAAALLSGLLPIEVAENFVGCQWSKLVINQVNALPAITGLSVQETIAHPRLRRLITRAMRETVDVGHATGIVFGALQGLTDARLTLFRHLPLALAAGLPKLMARRMGPVPNLGSTLQSIRRGRRSEIDYLSGAVVDAAATAGIPAPMNALFVGGVHDVERAGAFLDIADVIERSRTGR